MTMDQGTAAGRATGDGRRIGVLLAIFDFPMLLAGFRAAIDAEPDLTVVDQVVAREGLREAVEGSTADVVVVECNPFGPVGCTTIEMLEAVRAGRPAVRVIALECRCAGEQFSAALKAGADGFLDREATPADVVAAIRSVGHGQTYVSPSIVTRMVNTYVLRSPHEASEDPYETLSEREREVMLLAAVGHTNREIATILHLSEQTVHNYRAQLMEKLDLHDRLDLLKYAIRRGLVDVADL
jgi:DNA-binding NarL/FixJ family response regulator